MASYQESTTSTGKAHVFYNNATEVASITGDGILTLVQGGTTITLSPTTGWADPTGTPLRTTFDISSATTAAVGARLAALILDLKSKGILAA